MRRSFSIGALVLAVLLSACGGDGTSDLADTSAATSAPTAPTATGELAPSAGRYDYGFLAAVDRSADGVMVRLDRVRFWGGEQGFEDPTTWSSLPDVLVYSDVPWDLDGRIGSVRYPVADDAVVDEVRGVREWCDALTSGATETELTLVDVGLDALDGVVGSSTPVVVELDAGRIVRVQVSGAC